jgi:hypothetical protein
MSSSKETTIWCDRCHRWDRVSGGSVQSARATLRLEGWVRTREDGQLIDLCPVCVDSRQGGQPK